MQFTAVGQVAQQDDVGYQEQIDQFELDLTGLVPDRQHSDGCPEGTEECQRYEGGLPRPPHVVLRLVLIPDECQESYDVQYQIGYQDYQTDVHIHDIKSSLRNRR